MADEDLWDMTRQTPGAFFEIRRIRNQSLTFAALRSAMEKRSVALGEEEMRSLSLTGTDGQYTSLALLLSDQCPATIEITLFQGNDNAELRDHREFSGSLAKQLYDAWQFIDQSSRTRVICSGHDRLDLWDVPEAAVREALINCVVHRDYSISGGNTLINSYTIGWSLSLRANWSRSLIWIRSFSARR